MSLFPLSMRSVVGEAARMNSRKCSIVRTIVMSARSIPCRSICTTVLGERSHVGTAFGPAESESPLTHGA